MVKGCAGIFADWDNKRVAVEACGPAFLGNGTGLGQDVEVEGFFTAVATS